MAHTVYLGLGSNLGDKRANIQRAIDRIGEQVGTVERVSSFYETEPWGFQSEHSFVNAVIAVTTTSTPQEVLALTQQIECQLGKRKAHATRRSKKSSTYKDRPIDIDILLYDDITVDEPNLKIPHPLMHQRDFVMIPLREIQQYNRKENRE